MKTASKGIIWGLVTLWVGSGLATADPKMRFSDFRIFEPPAVARHAAAYGKLTNIGSSEDTLVAVKSEVARATELHKSVMTNGIAQMRTVANVHLRPGDSLTLKPKSYHVMFKGLTQPLKAGDVVRLIWVFESMGEVVVETPVLQIQ